MQTWLIIIDFMFLCDRLCPHAPCRGFIPGPHWGLPPQAPFRPWLIRCFDTIYNVLIVSMCMPLHVCKKCWLQ